MQVGAGEEKRKEGGKKKNKEGSGDGGRAEVNVLEPCYQRLTGGTNCLRLTLRKIVMVYMVQGGTFREKNQESLRGKKRSAAIYYQKRKTTLKYDCKIIWSQIRKSEKKCWKEGIGNQLQDQMPAVRSFDSGRYQVVET